MARPILVGESFILGGFLRIDVAWSSSRYGQSYGATFAILSKEPSNRNKHELERMEKPSPEELLVVSEHVVCAHGRENMRSLH